MMAQGMHLAPRGLVDAASLTTVSKKVNCETVADNRVARILVGSICGMDGEVSGKQGEIYSVTDTCVRLSLVEVSYKLTVEDNGTLILTTFRQSGTCEGDFSGDLLKIGVCKEGISAVVTGVTLGDVAVQILPAKEGTTLGNMAIVHSAICFVLVVAMVALR